MAKESGRLTTLSVKNACTGKHFDGGGLYLEVMPSGSRIWRLKYRIAGRETRATFGAYPEVSLTEARDRRSKARAQLRDGIDPNAAKAERAVAAQRDAGAAFTKVAAYWLASRKLGWADETHRKAEYVLKTYLAPKLKRHSIATLTTPQAKLALAGIPPSLALKARGYLNNIVEFAILEGLREDGRLLSLRGAVPKVEKGHIPAAVDVADVRAVATAINDYPILVTRAALTLAMLTAQRPGNVVSMEWAEVDLDAAEWSIPANKMKTRHAHVVPLSRQAIDELDGMLAHTKGKQYVFPALYRQNTPHLHRDALSNALRKMGFQGKHATHGFRGMFRTVARERLNIPADVLEAQLAHAKRNEIQKAYDRTQFLAERHSAMQRWANYLSTIRSDSGNVLPMRQKSG
ncbi:integrase [Stenotrophomonas rhizophila]|uniref:Integrase n=1 Tax=Stenotrophomonas rhizophila TaxID=216778 RepID=A0AAP5ED91_9GAMM|nr:integrase arm-type DNA-binding domain-containing protein [Stenotrophomonas rhizophila]MDQ1108376.1 integrase [Stenotrophomonas rhizophila]